MTRVLVVEDDPSSSALLTYLLDHAGYETATAANGVEALEAARRDRPDLVLMDVQMPVMDGLTAAAAFRADPDLREVPLVAVTAIAMVGDRDKVLSAGFAGYITKPVAPETFVADVEQFLVGTGHAVDERAPVPRQLPSPKTRSRGIPGGYPREDAWDDTDEDTGDEDTGDGKASVPLVLVVDDRAINLALVREVLEPSGIRVRCAHDVAEGLRIAHRRPPNLIISDLHLPQVSGFDLLDQVRHDEVLRHVPVMILTSSAFRGDEAALADSLGAAAFATRPIEPPELLAQVRALMATPR